MPSRAPVRCARQGYDPKAIEGEVTRIWADEDTRSKVRALRAEAPPFYFVDGPPYTSGHIHLGTAWNKVMKDVLVRYRTMLGLNVRDQPGYDMHGLPIEVKVERELGIANKKEIEAFGIGNFVEKCKAFSLKFLDDMTEEFQELGVWMDWDHPYRTIDDAYIEGAWWVLARAHEKGLLYRDNRGGLPWCPRCETALAQAEVEYEDRTDPSIHVKFKLEDRDEHLVIWTTTPWTLPANNAVAVHPELTYARVLATTRDGSQETVLVEETLVEALAHAARYTDTTVLDHVAGAELEGLGYVHPFRDEVPYHQERRAEAEYTVLLGEHVAADRTGLVHTATGHGAEDFEIGKAYGIPPFCPVGGDGTYTELAGELAGLVVKKAPKGEDHSEGTRHADDVVIALLEGKGALLAQGLDEHSYGHCWRCKTPILYLTTEQWFLAVTQVKEKMLAEVSRVKWTPEWAGSARQKDWVENARDWTVSRQRYWGIPLPIWTCQACDAFDVVASKAELLERSGRTELADLHRPWVDEVALPCKACEGTMHRVPDVLDVWFDSAVASWASLGYPSDASAYEQWFPGDLILEGLDQTRGWFYSQLAAGVVAMDRVPYEEVVMHGFVHDQEGRPMSKSLGNIVAPGEVIAEHGVDALRWSLLETSAPWDDLHYGPDLAKEAQRALNILWNVHYFSTQYMALDGYEACPPDWSGEPPDDPVDAWFLSRIQATIEAVTGELVTHNFHRAARALRAFVLEDLSRWYVRLNRDRAWKGDDTAKRVLYDLLTVALATVARLAAPLIPHTTEAIWRDLYPEGGSVHAQDWPKARPGLRSPELDAAMDQARSVVEAVGQAREKAGLSLRWPVPRVVLVGEASLEGTLDRLGDVLRDQCNAKAIEYAGERWGELAVAASPVRATVGPTFKQDAGRVMEAIRGLSPDEAAELKAKLEGGGTAELAGFSIGEGMVSFSTEVPEGILGASFQGGSCFVDAHLDDALKAEGLAREVLRRIQEMRKDAGLALEETVPCVLETDEATRALLEPRADAIAREGRAELSFGPAPKGQSWTLANEAAGVDATVRIALG